MSQVKVQGNAGGTGSITIQSPNTNNTQTLTLPDGTGTFTVNGLNSNIVSGTAVASTSGTSIDFTGIPSWVKRITVMFQSVGSSSTANHLIQLGTSGGVATTGYFGTYTCFVNSSPTTSSTTTGFTVASQYVANQNNSGSVVITRLTGNTWTYISILTQDNTARSTFASGSVALSGVLTTVRLTTTNGTDTFTSGNVNILYE